MTAIRNPHRPDRGSPNATYITAFWDPLKWWCLDFNLAVPSLEDSIRTSQNAVDLWLDPHQSRTSASCSLPQLDLHGLGDNVRGPFPEEVQLDPPVAVEAGYGETKYVTVTIR